MPFSDTRASQSRGSFRCLSCTYLKQAALCSLVPHVSHHLVFRRIQGSTGDYGILRTWYNYHSAEHTQDTDRCHADIEVRLVALSPVRNPRAFTHVASNMLVGLRRRTAVRGPITRINLGSSRVPNQKTSKMQQGLAQESSTLVTNQSRRHLPKRLANSTCMPG